MSEMWLEDLATYGDRQNYLYKASAAKRADSKSNDIYVYY